MFFKPIVTDKQTAAGKIEIKNGEFDWCLEQIKSNKRNLSKVILEEK